MVMESMRMCMLKTGSVSPEGAFKDKQESNDDNISALFWGDGNTAYRYLDSGHRHIHV